MAPLRGWGTRGERLITHVPHGHWQTMTFIGALRHDRIEAPWVLNGPINAEAFKTYVRVELIKTLKPNDIVRCEKPCVEASRPSNPPSPIPSTPSHRRNAPTTSQMLDTSQAKCETL